jgi:hypothetical protein
MPHCPAEVRVRGAHEKMVVIAHDAISVNFYVENLRDLVQKTEEDLSVSLTTKRKAPAGALIHEVVPGSFVFDPEGTSHGTR